VKRDGYKPNKWYGFGLELGLWRLHTMAVQVERPWEFIAKGLAFRGFTLMAGQRLQILSFIAHFFGLSPKVWLVNSTASQLGRP